MADVTKIEGITVSKDIVIKSSGLGIDFGGSVIKIVYRTKDDYEKACDPKNLEPLATLRTVSFAREDRKRAFEFARDNAFVIRDGEEFPSVFTTGCGSSEYTKEIVEICKITPKIITEHDCFAKCFHFLSHVLSRDQLLHPIPYDAMEHPLGFCEELHSLLKLMNANKISKVHDLEMVEKLEEAVREVRNTDFVNLPKDSRPLAEAEDIFPCLLAINGSAFSGFIVKKDASFEYLDATQLGGRFFHGLGSLLTGCKTYEELIEMAAKGNHKKIDTHKNDMLFDTGEDDLAAKFGDMKTDSLVFNFGKAVGKTAGDFEPADIASALLRGFVKEKAERCRLVASLHDLKSIFFVGSFVNHEIVRKVYTEMFTFSNYFIDAVHRKKIAISKYDFVKNGSHFGALGCLINTLDPFI